MDRYEQIIRSMNEKMDQELKKDDPNWDRFLEWSDRAHKAFLRKADELERKIDEFKELFS